MNALMSLKKNLHGLILLVIMLKTVPATGQQENLNIMEDWIEWSDGKNMLIHHLNKQAFKYLDEREKQVAELKTREDWADRQKKVKDILMKIIGPFPEKTALNPRITGVVKKQGFRIEKVIYESLPGFYVTGCLFIPDGIRGKRPAIIQCSGHSFPSFKAPDKQKMIYNLVRKGFIVFATDVPGQGERVQYWDNEKKGSLMGISPTGEHTAFGNQMFIAGSSAIRYFIWDGIRAVDYLMTRKEVDPDRIGIFGNSGGGTQTTFISAFDERVKAAAPSCYITGFRRLLESIGPQDAEQLIYHGISNGIDQADLLELRAPRPLLICSMTLDGFSIQGAVETYREVKRAYKAFGKEENAGQAVADEGHGLGRNILAVYDFFQRVLDLPGTSGEEEFEGFDPGDLQVTATGQLSTSLGGETAFSINEKETREKIRSLMADRKNIDNHLSEVSLKAKELSGYAPPSSGSVSVFRGRYHRNGYSVEMHALPGEGNCIIPLLVFVPESGSRFPGLIYLNPRGKINDAAAGGKIEQLVRKGYLVAAPDVSGTGETAPGRTDGSDLSGANYLALLTGRSITGIDAGDIVRVANFLRTRKDTDPGKIGAIAFNEICPALLHAAVMDKSISSVIMAGGLISYKSLVLNRFYDRRFYNYSVAGMLASYDLPDLIGCIAPRKTGLVDLRDQLNRPAEEGIVDEELQFPRKVYSLKNVPDNIKIVRSPEEIGSVTDWCFDKTNK
jgi:dienelactone hydrolase